MFTAATTRSAPSPYCVATPPPTARPPWEAANSRARRSISGAGIPTTGATRCGVGSRRSRRAASAGALPQGFERERLMGDVPAADLLDPRIDELAERPGLEPGEEHDPPTARFLHLPREPADGIVPRQLLPLAVRPAGHWLGDAIGVVQPLQRRLAARAEPPLVDGGFRVALELDHAAFAHLGVQPAPGGAFAARRGVVRRGPRDLILGGHDVGDEVLGRLGPDAARRERGGTAARRTQDLEESSAIHRRGPQ